MISDDLATLRRGCYLDGGELPDVAEVEAALDRVEAEIARLTRERNARLTLDEVQELKERAEAAEAEAAHQRLLREDAEAEVARLRDGLRHIVEIKESGYGSSGWGTDFYEIARALLAEDGAARPVPVESLLTDDDYEVLAEDGAA